MITEMGDVRTEPTLNKKIKIESKETMLARSMKSPDYFDAGWMAFLDSDLCSYERIFNYIAPTQVLEVNKHFKRIPIWSMPRNGGTKRKSRWSRMDG